MIYDVVVAGAGPVGLFLACELRLAGCSVLVLEQAKDSHSPLKTLPLGLRGLWGPTVEAFYRRGLLDDLAAQSSKQVWGAGVSTGDKAERRPAGHFAGIFFYADKIDFSRWRYRLPGPAAIPMPSDMEHIESVLTARANAMGVAIRRGFGVESFEQSDDEVSIRAEDKTFLGRWLVGCDGGRSTVRKAGGFDFVGTSPEFTGYSLQVEMADPAKIPFGRHYTPTGMYHVSPV